MPAVLAFITCNNYNGKWFNKKILRRVPLLRSTKLATYLRQLHIHHLAAMSSWTKWRILLACKKILRRYHSSEWHPQMSFWALASLSFWALASLSFWALAKNLNKKEIACYAISFLVLLLAIGAMGAAIAIWEQGFIIRNVVFFVIVFQSSFYRFLRQYGAVDFMGRQTV